MDEETTGVLWQLLDDMSDGTCVCEAAKLDAMALYVNRHQEQTAEDWPGCFDGMTEAEYRACRPFNEHEQ